MTQTECENQNEDDVRRSTIGSVTIENYNTWTIGETRYYVLKLWGLYFQYRTKPGTPTLYTMDEHGNCKAPSVFREPLTIQAA